MNEISGSVKVWLNSVLFHYMHFLNVIFLLYMQCVMCTCYILFWCFEKELEHTSANVGSITFHYDVIVAAMHFLTALQSWNIVAWLFWYLHKHLTFTLGHFVIFHCKNHYCIWHSLANVLQMPQMNWNGM